MEATVIQAPRYRLIQPLYAGDQYIAEGTEIEFNGTPNEQMECLNKAAEDKMTAYLKTLEGGKTPRVEDVFYLAMRNRPKEDGTVTLPHAVADVPQMGHLRPQTSDVKILEVPATPVRVKKVMGTIVPENTALGDHSI